MPTVLVTGGTGTLGRELVPRLTNAGYKVRIMSRRAGESNQAGDVEWAQANLESGDGVAEAAREADAIVHAASSPFKKTDETDVEGTRRLLEIARADGVSHFYYISIVGIERIPTGYYKAKVAAEQVVEQGGVPYTILRATQFHPLLDTFLRTLFRRGPFLFLPGAAKFQLIDAGEVAEHMVETLGNGPSGRLPDVGGPEVLTAKGIARDWKAASGENPITIPVPAMGPLSGFAKGYNCVPENKFGRITWKEWLTTKYGASS
jgi:uncharacterized protein YbjT (DUF2867 family)